MKSLSYGNHTTSKRGISLLIFTDFKSTKLRFYEMYLYFSLEPNNLAFSNMRGNYAAYEESLICKFESSK